ncbi:MAG: mitochondrial fission ELM1 family protein [Micavibrio aeruginosavorus]|uniref:Mitochondrial fission ELM1 family protein n=1 Tax=Micavibrio aeruginosavorus TaxID=349221 RepID=A0A7T5UIR3_9BACT|nr:MAG: mitochondrial fission ELM1 family protein [Micavibrio aeruginosavorus]
MTLNIQDHFSNRGRPYIYYILGDDEPTRGDSHGYAGIGRAMARKLGGTFIQIDDEMLGRLYPGQTSSYERENCFLRDYGVADIVICRGVYGTGRFTDRDTVMIEGRNENLGTQLDKDMLVAHHITPELLHTEGLRFREHYQDQIEGTLIAFLLVENIASEKLLGESLVLHALQNDQATIFLTTCWRTTESDYEKVMQGCRDAIRDAGAESRVRLVSYHLNDEKGNPHSYNPYTGLLDQSDHIILWGRSHSMFSEAAATGKTIHVGCLQHDNGGYRHLEGKGIVRAYSFDMPALETVRGTPVNKTVEIAEKMIKERAAYSLRKKGMLPFELDDYARYEAERQIRMKTAPA